MQILSGVLLRAAGGKLELAATDMELSIRTTLDAQVDGDGAVVVPGRLLVDLSRLLPDSEVTIEFREEENVLRVGCGPAEYRLNTYGAEDFPRLPDTDAAPTNTVSADALLDTLAAVGRAVSRDEARPVLTGILVRFGEGKLVMAATDSYRLSYKETPVEGKCRTSRRSSRRARSKRSAASHPPAARSSSASRRTRCCSGSTARG